MCRGVRWTIEEDNFIRRNYRIMKYVDMAAHLGRTPGAVASHAFHINLIKPKSPDEPRRHSPGHSPSRPLTVKPFRFDVTPCSERGLGYVR